MRHAGVFYVLSALVSALAAITAGKLAWSRIPDRVQYVLIVLLMAATAGVIVVLWLAAR